MNLLKSSAFYIVILICIAVTGSLQGQPRNMITDLYQRDYDIINRTVIVLTGRPNYSLEQRAAERQIIITMENSIIRENLPLRHDIISPVIESIIITPEEQNRLTITINTRRRFYLEYFALTGPEFRLVIDIYNSESPTTSWEKLAFGKFYYAVGQNAKAEKMMLEVMESDPQITSVHYYLGRILLNRGEIERAAVNFYNVDYTDPEYLQAQMELTRLGLIDLEFGHEIEQLFGDLREYFLRAGDLNRQQLLVALTSAAFGDTAETDAILSRIDYSDENLISMIRNIRHIYENLSGEQYYPQLLTILGDHTPAPSIDFIRDMGLLAAIIIAAIALIVYIITSSIWRRKFKRTKQTTATPTTTDIEGKSTKERLAEKIITDNLTLTGEKPREWIDPETVLKHEEPEEVKPSKPEKPAGKKPEKIAEKPEKPEKAKKPAPAKRERTKSRPAKKATAKKPVSTVKSETSEVKKNPAEKQSEKNATEQKKKPKPSVTKASKPARKNPNIPDNLTDEFKATLVIKLHNDGWEQDAISKELEIDPANVSKIISNEEKNKKKDKNIKR